MEAKVEQTPEGKAASGEGWFIVNAREGRWGVHPKFGAAIQFEGDQSFEQVGVNLRMLMPGQPNCYYHRETLQEDFLVLAGECIVILDGQERHLRAWDFVHCPPGTNHVFVGAGEGPCLILMLGSRVGEESITYPVEPVALKHGAGVTTETNDPREAYAGVGIRKKTSAPAAALELMQAR